MVGRKRGVGGQSRGRKAYLLPSTRDDKVYGVDIGRLGLAADDVDVDVFRDLDVPLREGLEERGLLRGPMGDSERAFAAVGERGGRRAVERWRVGGEAEEEEEDGDEMPADVEEGLDKARQERSHG